MGFLIFFFFFLFIFSGWWRRGGGPGLLWLFRGVRAPGPAPLPSSGGRWLAGRAVAAASTMMMSLSSKQPFGLPHGGGGLHETKYSALHTASPCPSAGATAPAASSPSSTGTGGSAGRGSSSGSGSGPGGGGGSGSGSGSGSGPGGGGAEAMRRACLPAPPVGARRPALRGAPRRPPGSA